MRAVHHMSHSLYRTNLSVCVFLKGWLTEITFNAYLSCQLVVKGQIRSARIQYAEDSEIHVSNLMSFRYLY